MDNPQEGETTSKMSASVGEEMTLHDQSDIEKQPTNENAQQTLAVQTQQQLFPETDLDQGIVGWEGQNDPENPQNFAPKKKWALLALISAFTFISPLASSMFSPAVVYMGDQFHETNEVILALSVSIYLIGYTVRIHYPLTPA